MVDYPALACQLRDALYRAVPGGPETIPDRLVVMEALVALVVADAGVLTGVCPRVAADMLREHVEAHLDHMVEFHRVN